MITCKHYRLGFDILALVLFLAVILYALDCKKMPAASLAFGFAICHLIFAIVNNLR